MPTECSTLSLDFGTVEGRRVEAAFDAGLVTYEAGALLLGATDRAIGMIDRFALCFHDEPTKITSRFRRFVHGRPHLMRTTHESRKTRSGNPKTPDPSKKCQSSARSPKTGRLERRLRRWMSFKRYGVLVAFRNASLASPAASCAAPLALSNLPSA